MQSKVQIAMLESRPRHDGTEANRGSAETLFWDGRLDNRGDLLFRLGASLPAALTNAALAAAAYDRWGTDGLVHLIGDWSAVIRDRRTGTIVLASDFAGVRPLYTQSRGGASCGRVTCRRWWAPQATTNWTRSTLPVFSPVAGVQTERPIRASAPSLPAMPCPCRRAVHPSAASGIYPLVMKSGTAMIAGTRSSSDSLRGGSCRSTPERFAGPRRT